MEFSPFGYARHEHCLHFETLAVGLTGDVPLVDKTTVRVDAETLPATLDGKFAPVGEGR